MCSFGMRIKPMENYVDREAGGTGSHSTFWASQIANRLKRWNIYIKKANSSMCPVNALTTWVYKEVHLMEEKEMHTFYEVYEKIMQAGLLFLTIVA